MDYSSIINIILNQVGLPFNLSVFCNGSAMSITINSDLSDEVVQNLKSQLSQLVSVVYMESREDPNRVYINLEH